MAISQLFLELESVNSSKEICSLGFVKHYTYLHFKNVLSRLFRPSATHRITLWLTGIRYI